MFKYEFVRLTSKLGVIILMLGIGMSVAGLLAYLGENSYANKGTMIAGLVMGAIGHLLVTARSVMHDDF